jgi:aminoglycoside 3-N-acetyltransferase
MKIITRDLKQTLRRRHKAIRLAYIRRYCAFTPEDLLNGLQRIGVHEGDSLFVHSSFDRFEGFQGKPTHVNAILLEAVGQSGHVLMPTLPFSGTAVEYAARNPVFDVIRTPSHMGLLTELFRRQSGVLRSIHPTHAVAVYGARADYFAAEHYRATTPCGRGTPYSRLLDEDGKVLLLGTGISVFTFYHYVEEEIETLLPFPVFTKETFTLRSIDSKGNEVVTRTRLFDPAYSRKRNMDKLVPHMKNRGVWNECQIGNLTAILLSAKDVFSISVGLAQKGVFFYDL